jgi:hypothetical protein
MSHTAIPPQGRAQGAMTIPWPPGLGGAPKTCCVALRVQVTQDRIEKDVAILRDLVRVRFGEPGPTLRKLVRQCFKDAARATVLYEIEALGAVDPECPLALERLHEDEDGICIHVEVLILPLGSERSAEFAELLAGVTDPARWHADAWEWAEMIEDEWRAASPSGALPLRFLEDAPDFHVDHAVGPHDYPTHRVSVETPSAG